MDLRKCRLPFSSELFVSQFAIQKYIEIYRTIILPVVLNWHEFWSLTLREEHGVRVSENTVVRNIFGSKTDKITGEWRRLLN